MSKNREKKHAAAVAERATHAQHATETVESAAEHHEQHLVEAPKGTSRGRFIFNLFLVVFLLLIFSITGPMMASLSGGGGGASGEIFLSWVTPDGEKRELDYTEYINEKRAFGTLEPLLSMLGMGQIDPGEDINLSRFLILEQMAYRAGLHVSDKEVNDSILLNFGSEQQYSAYIGSRRGMSKKGFETNMRRLLVVRRYLTLTNSAAAEVISDDVIDRWLEGATEYNFEFVELLAEDFADAARAELPDDEALEDYFTALPVFQKSRFNTERSMSAKLAWFDPSAERDYSMLFERYPRPEDEDADEMAQNYYQGFSHVRFARPADASDEEQKEAETAGDTKYFTFDEVADQVRLEAPVYYSMMDWLSDMQARLLAEEVVDLQTEAISLGFKFELVDPRSRSSWVDGEESWAGRYFFGSISGSQEGQFNARVAVEEEALVIAQIVEIRPPALPPFAEIRDEVADKWVEEQQPKLAVAKLEELRDTFGERPEEGLFETSATSEEFAAAVEAAGYSVQERGWKRQFPTDGEQPTSAEFYIRSKSILFTEPEGTVSAAEATRDGKAAYLMRAAGDRPGDPATMTPAEAAQARTALQSAALTEYYTTTLANDDWLRTEFHLMLRSEQEPETPSE